MDRELYQYLKELHTFIEHQAKKIKKLEEAVTELKSEIITIKERPPLQVGNIEYKFDQLKVETLEGTLNIGLNPSDLDGIDDFSVDNASIKTPISPKPLFKRSMEIETIMRDYLEQELPNIYQTTKEKLNLTLDESYYHFIKDDILKQLPNRIQTHLKNLPAEERDSEEETAQKIVPNLKAEIQQGVYLFLEQLQNQTKGD